MSKRNKFKSGDWNDQSKGGGKKKKSKNRKEKLVGKSKSQDC